MSDNPGTSHADDEDLLRARLANALKPPLAASLEHWRNDVTRDVSVIPIPGSAEIQLVNMLRYYTVVVHCLNDKMHPFIGHSTIFDVYVGNANLVHRLQKDAKKDELPDAIKSLSLDECHNKHWMDAEFLDGEVKVVHAYGLGSNAKKRTRAANIAAAVTVALEFCLKPTEYSEATNFNQIMEERFYLWHKTADSEVVLRASDDAIM